MPSTGKRELRFEMENKDQRRAVTGKRFRAGQSLSTEQTIVAWATVVMGAVFMAAGGLVMVLSLS